MVEKKKKTETDKKAKTTERIKATVGAWWKSTVVKETTEEKVPEKSTTLGKTQKKGTGARRSTQKDGLVEKEPKPARKRPVRKKKPVSSGTESTATVDTATDATVEERPKPARKRSPRKKTAPPATEGLNDAEVTVTIDLPSAEDVPPSAKKPARKRSARKSGPSKKVDATAPVDSQPAVVGESEEVEIEEPKAAKKRPPRKRGPRKAKTKAVEAEQLEATTDGTDKEVEAEGQPAVKEEVEDIAVDGGDDSLKPQAIKEKKKAPKPVIKLLINAEEPEECRLALLEDGRLESIHVATVTRAQTKNNIYKGRIVAIEANLQAAFVEYGTDKNGFLPFSEIHPEYYRENVSDKAQKLIDQQQWKKLSIKDVVEKGQEVLVQVVKEEVGKKGANMTTFLSLPGRCVVLMPGSDSTGISRKISGEERRSQLREYVKAIGIPEGIGWIVRTASIDITKAALSRDVGYLLRLWSDVKKKGQNLEGVGLIYQDHNHVLRFLREHYDPDIQEILVDDKEAITQVEEFVGLLPAKQRNVKIKLHRGSRPIFNQYSIEDQIESIYQPGVNLPSGGSIVIDPTEALVAIDVNSGSTSKGQNFEESIFQANMEAAKELARQLRLRDLGGLIVVDFIDMRSKKNVREVERQVKAAMKRDKAKVDISRISKFGLMQISRQKLGAPIEAGNYRVCTHCKGRGLVRSVETLALYYLRRIHTGATRKVVNQIECHFPLDVAQYLLNYKRHELRELEGKYNAEVIIIAEPSFKPADNEIIFHKEEKDDSAKKRS